MAMGLFDSSNKKVPLAIDASEAINLSACGLGRQIVRVMRRRVIVADVVSDELRNDPPAGRDDAGQLRAWIDAGLIEEVPLASVDDAVFLSLVSGRAEDTLDDGEAATIALAIAHSTGAVLDERKAIRICSTRHPSVQLASTADLLLSTEVMREFGEAVIGDALFAALTGARMRVLPHHVEAVLRLLGRERAALCRSLPQSSRRSR
jgi:predicted nucleic acid-binding protein